MVALFPMSNCSQAILVMTLLPVLTLSIGCSDRLKTHPVSGRARFTSGGPVHVGTVELKSHLHGVQARGEIQNDGTFTLTTYAEGDGAVAGSHDCVIVQFIVAEDLAGHAPSAIGVIDRRYASYATSGLVVEIEPGGPNEIVLEVEGIRATQPENHEHPE